MKRILFFITLCALLLNTTSPVSALSAEQKKVFDSGILYFDVEDAATLCANDAINLIGNDNLEKIYRFFLGKDLSPEQAAGIAGNASAESGGDPTIVSPSGYRGIFQWDKNDRWPRVVAWAQKRNLDPLALATQLGFAYDEATERGNIEGIKAYTTIELTAWYWGRFFEGATIGDNSSKTPLSNVQALEKRTVAARDILASYSSQSGTSVGGSSNCAGGNGQATQFIDGFTVYSQYDPDWKDLPYSTSTIGVSGCGPAAMAMIITNLTGQSVTPVQTSNYARDIGMYVEGSGSSWQIGPRLAEQWGLKSEPVDNSVSAITAALRAGKLIIAPGQGAKPFTSGGHFIVIRGITADGKFRVGDSGHTDTSDKDWDPQFIVDNMRDGGSYAIYK